jgi:hypothetical protein
MEPPSEALARAQTQPAVQSIAPARGSFPLNLSRAPAAAPAVEPQRAASARPFAPSARPPQSVPAARQTFHEQAPHAPQQRPTATVQARGTSAQAPEAWRNAVRSMAERGGGAPGPASPPPTQAGGNSLRLKLDVQGDEEEHYRGVPKSKLPGVLLWLIVLGLLIGGGAYYAEGHGGVGAIASRLHLFSEDEPEETPDDAAPPAAAAPSAAAAPTAAAPSAADPAGQAPPSAASPKAVVPAANPPAQQPNGLATPTEENARQLADPDPPGEQVGTKPVTKPAASTKPAAAKPPAKKPAPHASRPAVRHDPIVKVRDLEGAPAAPSSSAPPEPPDMPYAPPYDPPAPDEPR